MKSKAASEAEVILVCSLCAKESNGNEVCSKVDRGKDKAKKETRLERNNDGCGIDTWRGE
jgi:hypothetical protein